MTSAEQTAEEHAWRVHENLSDWTARVDVKASAALAIESAVLGFVITLATDGKTFDGVTGASEWVLAVATILLLASVILAISVVLPQLRSRYTQREYKQNTIYFGHLRHWDASELTRRLVHDPVRLDELSRQLVNMSKIIWRKHRWLQWSLGLFFVGVLLVSVAYVLVKNGVGA